MPNQDGTGPSGRGKPGRGLGPCGQNGRNGQDDRNGGARGQDGQSGPNDRPGGRGQGGQGRCNRGAR